MRVSRKQRTADNQEVWLTPFVTWLEEQAMDRPVVVTSLTISDYLQKSNRFKTGQSYDRAGAAIVQFVN